MSSAAQYKDKINFYLSSLDELGEVLIDQEGSSGITKGVLRIILGTMMASKGAIIGIKRTKCKILSAHGVHKPKADLKIDIKSKIGDSVYVYDGQFAGISGSVDKLTQTVKLNVILNNNKLSIPIDKGLFVESKIFGKTYEEVFVIPNQAINHKKEVYVVKGDVLLKKEVEIKRNGFQAHCMLGVEAYGINHPKKTAMILLNNILLQVYNLTILVKIPQKKIKFLNY